MITDKQEINTVNQGGTGLNLGMVNRGDTELTSMVNQEGTGLNLSMVNRGDTELNLNMVNKAGTELNLNMVNKEGMELNLSMVKARSITNTTHMEAITNMVDNLKGKAKKAKKERRDKKYNLDYQVKVKVRWLTTNLKYFAERVSAAHRQKKRHSSGEFRSY